MDDKTLLIEILKQQRNQALDALAEAFVRVNNLEKELAQAKLLSGNGN
jgi:hypothetical protein